MNQLFRGVERSRCLLRASRQAFSTSESASAAVGAQGFLITQQTETNNDRRSYPNASTPLTFRSSIALNRNFSSLSAHTTPSALEHASIEEVTPGHIIFFLQHHTANVEGAEILQSDFVQLCESSRPGKKKDAKVISTALKEFKRINGFILEMVGACAAVEGMLRSMTPTWKIQDGKPRLQAALFVAEQILDEKTGLYYAVETEMVDKVLGELHTGLLEMKENGMKLRLDNIGEEAKEEQTADEKYVRDALRVTEEVVKLLLERKCRPEWKMKRRARRKYLKLLQISSGPKRNTMKLATQISILIGGSAIAQEKIITPYDEAWKTKDVGDVVLKLIEEASAHELEEQKSES